MIADLRGHRSLGEMQRSELNNLSLRQLSVGHHSPWSVRSIQHTGHDRLLDHSPSRTVPAIHSLDVVRLE
jgi:hypothetical protein